MNKYPAKYKDGNKNLNPPKARRNPIIIIKTPKNI